MNRSRPLRRRIRTFGFATLIVAVANAMLAPAHATFVVDGAVVLPTNTSSDFTPTSGGPSNLGSFNIVINAGSALAGNAAAMAAFNRAAATWESRIADPITVNIDADLDDLDPGILGSAASVILQSSYSAIRGQMVSDASGEGDDAIVASLPTSAQFSATLPASFTLSTNMWATKANLKAIGFTGLDTAHGITDATITFSTNFSFDYDNSDGVTSGQVDFEGVAAHEIGHALGFTSIVDTIDVNLSTPFAVSPMPLDLFRFRDSSVNDPANDPPNQAQFTTFARDLVPGSNDVFDQVIPAWGDTEVLMSTGRINGDLKQASHWKDFLSLGIMDPTAAFGELLVFRENDFRALDLIGYEISAVPELRSLLALPLAGALVIGGHWLAVAMKAARTKKLPAANCAV